MNRLNLDRRAQVLAALVDGNSIRATCRMTDVAKATVLKLLVDVGGACLAYQREHLRGLKCRRLQVDEIWSFCSMKERNVSPERRGVLGYGDVWTFTAVDPDTKLVPCFHVGRRDLEAATAFLSDLAGRVVTRVQLTTDGHRMYLEAIYPTFGTGIDYAQLVKIYAPNPDGRDKNDPQRRYSPARFVAAERKVISGDPDERHISTSHVERSNLTMRMSQRRFTRLTNAFSKKVGNLRHAVALHFMHYNFARLHMTTRITPAQAAGVDGHLWTVAEIAEMAGQYAGHRN
jgi:IS1 family transposase